MSRLDIKTQHRAQTVVDNLYRDVARRIAARLPQGVRLQSLRLNETATSYAEWFAEDNG